MQTSYWSSNTSLPRFPALHRDLITDVVVIGGGITGLTAALLLRRAGLSVALLERDRVGGVDTRNTTAHLTWLTDLRPHKLLSNFGELRAQRTFEAGGAALRQIRKIVDQAEIDCEFSYVPGYLHAPAMTEAGPQDRKLLQRDAQVAAKLGFFAEYLEAVPLVRAPGVRIPNQAKFHPLKYLRGVLQSLIDDRTHICEHTEVSEVRETPLLVEANGQQVSCGYVVIATHVPLVGKAGFLRSTLLQTKLASYSSYAIGA